MFLSRGSMAGEQIVGMIKSGDQLVLIVLVSMYISALGVSNGWMVCINGKLHAIVLINICFIYVCVFC